MIKKLCILILFLIPLQVTIDPSIYVAKASVKPVVKSNYQTIKQKVEETALAYNVSAVQMMNTIECESNASTTIVGDHGTSFGLSQIHLPAHKNITKQQADNPDFAIQFMAQEFSQGRQYEWSCYRILYEKKES